MPEYLAIAAELRHELEQIEGFISVERFQSLGEPAKVLSLSFWRDEASVQRWRTHGQHRQAQRRGRDGVFRHYRLRVAAVVRDYERDQRREQAPVDSQQAHPVSPPGPGHRAGDVA